MRDGEPHKRNVGLGAGYSGKTPANSGVRSALAWAFAGTCDGGKGMDEGRNCALLITAAILAAATSSIRTASHHRGLSARFRHRQALSLSATLNLCCAEETLGARFVRQARRLQPSPKPQFWTVHRRYRHSSTYFELLVTC